MRRWPIDDSRVESFAGSSIKKTPRMLHELPHHFFEVVQVAMYDRS